MGAQKNALNETSKTKVKTDGQENIGKKESGIPRLLTKYSSTIWLKNKNTTHHPLNFK